MSSFKTGAKFTGKAVAAWVAACLVVVAIMATGIFGFGWFQRSTADFRGETAAIEKIKADPNTRIAAYNHFFDLCASIQGHEDIVVLLRDELESGDPNEGRREQIQSAITANESQRARKIRQYNQESAKDYTVGQFKASGLPYRLNIDDEETQCAA